MNFKRPLFKKKPLDVEVKGNVRNNEILGIKGTLEQLKKILSNTSYGDVANNTIQKEKISTLIEKLTTTQDICDNTPMNKDEFMIIDEAKTAIRDALKTNKHLYIQWLLDEKKKGKYSSEYIIKNLFDRYQIPQELILEFIGAFCKETLDHDMKMRILSIAGFGSASAIAKFLDTDFKKGESDNEYKINRQELLFLLQMITLNDIKNELNTVPTRRIRPAVTRTLSRINNEDIREGVRNIMDKLVFTEERGNFTKRDSEYIETIYQNDELESIALRCLPFQSFLRSGEKSRYSCRLSKEKRLQFFKDTTHIVDSKIYYEFCNLENTVGTDKEALSKKKIIDLYNYLFEKYGGEKNDASDRLKKMKNDIIDRLE